MKHLVLGTGLLIFLAVGWAVRFHFASRRPPVRFLVLSAVSAANFFVFFRELWLRPKDESMLLSALGLFFVSAALFAWALHASRSARLKLIYDADRPRFILKSGPYRFIRHPFYASYIPFWVGCAVATLHPANIAYALALVPVLALAARSEEKGFEKSKLAEAYAEYKSTAGLFWPKI